MLKVDNFFENAVSNLGPSVKIEDPVGFKWVTVKGLNVKQKRYLFLVLTHHDCVGAISIMLITRLNWLG